MSPEVSALKLLIDFILGVSPTGLFVLMIVLLLRDYLVSGKRLEKAERQIEERDAQLKVATEGWRAQAEATKEAVTAGKDAVTYLRENLPLRRTR